MRKVLSLSYYQARKVSEIADFHVLCFIRPIRKWWKWSDRWRKESVYEGDRKREDRSCIRDKLELW